MLPFPSNIGDTGMRRGEDSAPVCQRTERRHWTSASAGWSALADEGLLRVFSIAILFGWSDSSRWKKNLKGNTCSVWEMTFTLEKTFQQYRKSTVTIVMLDPSDANGLTSSSREEQMIPYVSACFGLYSKLTKQKTCNTFFPPKIRSFLFIASRLPTAAAQMGHKQPCPTIAINLQNRLFFLSIAEV